MKYKCCKCDKTAVWCYIPGQEGKDDYYCDDCVRRGCSCNIDPVTLVEDTDEKGRLFPCCEYLYDDRGFEVSEEDATDV